MVEKEGDNGGGGTKVEVMRCCCDGVSAEGITTAWDSISESSTRELGAAASVGESAVMEGVTWTAGRPGVEEDCERGRPPVVMLSSVAPLANDGVLVWVSVGAKEKGCSSTGGST